MSILVRYADENVSQWLIEEGEIVFHGEQWKVTRYHKPESRIVKLHNSKDSLIETPMNIKKLARTCPNCKHLVISPPSKKHIETVNEMERNRPSRIKSSLSFAAGSNQLNNNNQSRRKYTSISNNSINHFKMNKTDLPGDINQDVSLLNESYQPNQRIPVSEITPSVDNHFQERNYNNGEVNHNLMNNTESNQLVDNGMFYRATNNPVYFNNDTSNLNSNLCLSSAYDVNQLTMLPSNSTIGQQCYYSGTPSNYICDNPNYNLQSNSSIFYDTNNMQNSSNYITYFVSHQ